MAAKMQGYRIVARLWPPIDAVTQRDEHRVLPQAIDIECRVAAQVVGALTGSDFVTLAHDGTYTSNAGDLPAIGPAGGALVPILGVVMWDEGTKTAGQHCWVRVLGFHPYAKIDGSGTGVAINDALMAAASGKSNKLTNAGLMCAVALAAVTSDSYGKVLLADPLGVLTGLA